METRQAPRVDISLDVVARIDEDSRQRFAIAAAKVLASTAAMSIFVKYFDGLHLLALIPLAAVAYFAVLFALGGIDREDRDLIRSIVAGR